MITFTKEILDGFKDNTVTKIEVIVHQDFKLLEFKIKGVTRKTFSAPLSPEWLDAQTSDAISYVDGIPYSQYPIFSEKNFNALKDVLLLNTSLVAYSNNYAVLSQTQYAYLTQIINRNIELSQMTNGITLFHYSAMRADIHVVQIYSWRASNLDELQIKCAAGKTPLDYARENNHFAIALFLEDEIKKLSAHQVAPTQPSTVQINRPLTDANKQHILDSLRILGQLKQDLLCQKLIDAALADLVFPSVFKAKLVPLQSAYQATKDIVAVKSSLTTAIQHYFEAEGMTKFSELLNDTFDPEEWHPELLRKLAGCDIIIIENPYVEATIKDGKIYWGLNFGNQIYYRRPFYEVVVSEAITQNRSWRLTWKEFRVFKDAGKRTGTVSITAERFTNEILPFVCFDSARAMAIWQELRAVGILDKNLRLSQAWYPFSNDYILLKSINNDTRLYQFISNVLEKIANNTAYQEIIAQGMTIYRPARVSKKWANTGRITNNQSSSFPTKLWDVGVSRELRDHAISDALSPCIADHIPSQSQIKTLCEIRVQQYDREISNYMAKNAHALRDVPQDLMYLRQQKDDWSSQLDSFKSDKKGLPFWCIYITKQLDDTGDTTRTSKRAQQSLSFYSSVKKHIDDLKKDLKEGSLTLTQFLQALGAFRYMYSRMCKTIPHVNNRVFIHEITCSFFSGSDKENDRKEMDDLLIQEMQSTYLACSGELK